MVFFLGFIANSTSSFVPYTFGSLIYSLTNSLHLILSQDLNDAQANDSPPLVRSMVYSPVCYTLQ